MARKQKKPRKKGPAKVKRSPPRAAVPRKRPGPKGYPKLEAGLHSVDERALAPLLERFRDSITIDEGAGPLTRDQARARLPIPTPTDLDNFIASDPEAHAALFWTDTRPLRDILGWRSGQQKAPQPAFSKSTEGARLQPAEREQLANDVVEILTLAHALAIDSWGKSAAFEYELQAVEKLRALAAAHRKSRAYYRDRARAARMLMDLHGIYAQVSKEWPRKAHDRDMQRKFDVEVTPAERKRIMDDHRDALRRFCRAHDIGDVDATIARLERDGSQIRDGRGPAKEAARALQSIFPARARTIEESLDISPFEITRSTAAPDSFNSDVKSPPFQYDSAIEIVRKLLEIRTTTPLPSVGTSTDVPGWPLLKGEVLKAVRSVTGTPRGEEIEDDRLATNLVWFLLSALTRRPALLKELLSELNDSAKVNFRWGTKS